MSKKPNPPVLLLLGDVPDFCERNLSVRLTQEDIETLAQAYLLPVFSDGSEKFALTGDLESLFPLILHMKEDRHPEFVGRTLFSTGIPAEIRPHPNVTVEIPALDKDVPPAFYAAVRNLALPPRIDSGATFKEPVSIQYFVPARVLTSSPAIRHQVEEQLIRTRTLGMSRASDFARSADYMGSKRNLAAFLVEAISSVLPQDGAIVDLMCGSGAASGAFCRFWKTYASDAQRFCEILAQVQGAGSSLTQAETLLKQVVPIAQEHARSLCKRLEFFLNWEDRIFHGDIAFELVEDYRTFIAALPTFPSPLTGHGWSPTGEVKQRKQNPTLSPYCLFTCYFANVYFGLRQSIEIDSLRFAVDRIQSEHERRWALGALVATLSKVSSTYGGHFAQPALRGPSKITSKNVGKILEERAYSIIHEFSVRLLNLSEESERAIHEVSIVKGPWLNALSALREPLKDRRVLVYVDAPYKREEYSRYYHALETLVLYAYPSAVGRGKVPDKAKGERFQSEFFTRNEGQLTSAYASVIRTVMEYGWICAWSYADSGAASVVKVIESACRGVNAHVRSYAVPYIHKPQGGHHQKRVTEYLVVFIPENREHGRFSPWIESASASSNGRPVGDRDDR